ncbi:MAG: DUF4317 domain-containing protein [Eubacterium sp.]|nr:DUF4317 domain-containing protein [Eubacterium sp.]
MNKKEVNEVRKQMSYDNCTISRICGCYVDGEKNIRSTFKEQFLSLPEELGLKYFELMKKSLSGTLGKNLMDLEFSIDAEAPGSTHEFLLALRASELDDDELLERFYTLIKESYDNPENYLILLTYSQYDVPKKGSDNLLVIDGSDDVYDYLLCTICPVALDKAALWFNPETGRFEDRARDRIVGAPDTAFLFPAFTDRNTDIHSLLFYSKKADEIQEGLIDVLGCSHPFPAGLQVDSFREIITRTLDDECSIETVKGIHESICDIIAESEDKADPIMLDKGDIRQILAETGASQEKMEKFDASFDESMTEPSGVVQAQNVVNTRSFNIKTPDVSVKVRGDRTDLVSQRTVDHEECLVISLTDSVEVNGVPVRAKVARES